MGYRAVLDSPLHRNAPGVRRYGIWIHGGALAEYVDQVLGHALDTVTPETPPFVDVGPAQRAPMTGQKRIFLAAIMIMT